MQKKILFVCPKFYNYEKLIIEELNTQGYDVTAFTYDEEHCLKLNFFFQPIKKIISRFSSTSIHHLISPDILFKKINNNIRKLSEIKYDCLLVVKGFGISNNTIKNINANRKVIYQWDPLSRYPHIYKIYKSFDYTYTFDFQDSKNGFGEYLPNFIPSDLHKNSLNKFKIFYIGIYSDYRYEKLVKIKKWCSKENIPYDLLLIHKRKQCEDGLIKNKNIDIDEYRNRFSQSSIILEISSLKHNGFTQRYYEAIFSEKVVLEIKSSDDLNKLINSSKEDISKLKPLPLLDRKKLTDPLLINNWLHKILD